MFQQWINFSIALLIVHVIDFTIKIIRAQPAEMMKEIIEDVLKQQGYIEGGNKAILKAYLMYEVKYHRLDTRSKVIKMLEKLEKDL